MQELLHKFENVFIKPKGLPLSWFQDQGVQPINLKPYWYGSLQKDITKKMIKEMIESKVICNSTSPYASPIMLMKKKDGS